ncbi:hypothetical protein DNTS_031483 [Danionella cerebrum]|uniref:Uncharacterized protein n=1 Tax=Danionella cerebrum TaxID=2873325 RepID=A0A553PEQ1_9TELE|nr:hypothetical protein DNTS_031483 [Danionella translucida]
MGNVPFQSDTGGSEAHFPAKLMSVPASYPNAPGSSSTWLLTHYISLSPAPLSLFLLLLLSRSLSCVRAVSRSLLISRSGCWFISPHTSSGFKLTRGVWEIERRPCWAQQDSIIREVN